MKRLVICFLALTLCAPCLFGQDFFSKGKVALSSRDTSTAVQAFKDAIKANQKVAESNYYLGVISFAGKKYDEALGYLEASTKISDENADALSLLADIYVVKKNTAAAIPAYRRAQKYAPKSTQVAVGYGLALLAADSVDAAIVQLTRAKDGDPGNPAIFAGLGEAYLKQNVAPLAVMNYQKAIELAPKEFSYRYKIAQIFEKNRQYPEAVAQYDSVARLDSTKTEAYLSMGQILVRASGSQKKLAIAPLRKYVEKNPNSVEGAVVLSKALFLTEDYDDCAKAARKALDLDPKNADVWRQYAYSLTEMKDFKTAVTAFEKLKELKAFKPEDQTKYGNSLVGVGREEEAMSALLSSVQLDSTNCDPYFNLGSLYMKKQDWVNATKMFEKKITCDPKSVKSLSSYLNAAASYMQLKNWERTRQLLDKALEIYPDFLQARLWLARYYLQVDSLDQAKEQYDAVLQQASSNPEKYKREIGEAHSMTGSYFFTTQRYTAAIEEFRKAQASGYDNSGLHLSWGQAILQTLDPKEPQEDGKKKKDDAIKRFRRSIELEQNNAVAHLWLAQSLVLSRVEGDNDGNKRLQEEACGEYKKALRLQPGNKDATKGMERIGCK